MAWLAVHPDNTMSVRVPDEEGAPSFVLGFWPPREAEQIDALYKLRLRKKDGDEVSGEELLRATDANHELANRMVAYGVRGWSGFKLANGSDLPCPELETVKIDGREHKKLPQEAIEILFANKIRGELATRCWLFNMLTEEQKKTFGLRLPLASSTSHTAANGAAPEAAKP